MIKAVTVTNPSGESLKMDLFHPELSGFVITKIEGIGPGKAEIRTSELSSVDGGFYNSSHVPSRNIVLSLEYLFYEGETIEEIRQRSYRYFPLTKQVTILLETDSKSIEIDGYVESNEPDIFSQKEGASISIICPNPFFRSAGNGGKQTVYFDGSESVFEFPFENDSLTEHKLMFGNVTSQYRKNVYYLGDTDTGITITMHISGNVTNPVIVNESTGEYIGLNTNYMSAVGFESLVDGMDVIINTNQGKKKVEVIYQGIVFPASLLLMWDSKFVQLVPGDNLISYSADTGSDDIHLTIEYDTLYEGV